MKRLSFVLALIIGIIESPSYGGSLFLEYEESKPSILDDGSPQRKVHVCINDFEFAEGNFDPSSVFRFNNLPMWVRDEFTRRTEQAQTETAILFESNSIDIDVFWLTTQGQKLHRWITAPGKPLAFRLTVFDTDKHLEELDRFMDYLFSLLSNTPPPLLPKEKTLFEADQEETDSTQDRSSMSNADSEEEKTDSEELIGSELSPPQNSTESGDEVDSFILSSEKLQEAFDEAKLPTASLGTPPDHTGSFHLLKGASFRCSGDLEQAARLHIQKKLLQWPDEVNRTVSVLKK